MSVPGRDGTSTQWSGCRSGSCGGAFAAAFGGTLPARTTPSRFRYRRGLVRAWRVGYLARRHPQYFSVSGWMLRSNGCVPE